MRWTCVVFVTALGCAHAVVPALPSAGGPKWFELASPHFTIWTDGPVDRGKELLASFEARRLVVGRALNNTTAETRSYVIAVRDENERLAFVHHDFIGMATSERNPLRQPVIIIAADERDESRIVPHELTHVIAHGIVRN